MDDTKKQGQQRLVNSDMTIDELHSLVEQIVEQKLAANKGHLLLGDHDPAEVLESMWKNIIKAETDVPSPLEMLREEREQWYKPS